MLVLRIATGSSSKAPSHARRMKLFGRMRSIDWRGSLLASRTHESMSFSRVQANTSAWCLDQRVQDLVNAYNSTGNEDALIQFQSQRNIFLRALTLHLNQFFAIITDSSKVVFAERLQKQASKTSVGWLHSCEVVLSVDRHCTGRCFRAQLNFKKENKRRANGRERVKECCN